MANFVPNTDEREGMIIFGIIVFYLLVVGFFVFLRALGRISNVALLCSLLIVTLVYLPRFLIIKKIKDKDIIRIGDSSIFINGNETSFDDIADYRVKEKKPQVVFAVSNNLVVYKEAEFALRLKSSDVPIIFRAIGEEKIRLLKDFFDSIL